MARKVAAADAARKAEHDAWRDRAPELARWAIERLVNRTDRCLRYYADPNQKAKSCADPAKPADACDGHVDLARLERHFAADTTDGIMGVYSYDRNKCGKWVVIDIDRHDDDTPAGPNIEYALHLYDKRTARGLTCLCYMSDGRGGFHLWVLFASPVPAATLQRFGQWLVADYAERGLAKAPEVFPKGDGGAAWGSAARIPGRHHTRPERSYVYT